GHRAFIEFSDVRTPDPAEDSRWSENGWLAINRIVFSDNSKPPAGENLGFRRLLGTKPIDSRQTLARRYQQALQRALDIVKKEAGNVSAEECQQLAWLDWLLEHKLLGEPGATLNRLIAEYHHAEDALPVAHHVPSMADGDGIDEHVFIRGNHRTP